MKTGLDPIRLEVIKNAFDTIADDMAIVLQRAAHSSIVRDSLDFSTAICDANGEVLAQGVTTPAHLGGFHDSMAALIERFRGDVREGDVYIANDPYAATGQHLPDIFIVTPCFFEHILCGWCATMAHHADIGGLVPGSNSLGAVEIHQEGLRLPFMKLYDAGVVNQAILDILALNVRVPDQVIGDVKAQLASCLSGTRGILDLHKRYGRETVERYSIELHNYAERLARAELLEIPDGVYRFTDHIDGLGANPEPVIFQVKLTFSGDEVTADWTGSSLQVSGGVNAQLPATRAAVYTALRSVMKSDIPNCDGYTRPIHVTAPIGTVVNAVYPAPAGARGITSYRMVDCMLGALSHALGDRVAADGTGGSTLPTFAGFANGQPWIFCETFMGTWGATSLHDGQEGVPHMNANQSNVPVEMIEANNPLRILRYGIQPDSGGPGKYRGGNALVREYELLADQCIFTLRSDKRDFPPHGLFGGLNGSGPINLMRSRGIETVLPVLMTETIPIFRGDTFFHATPSGGGFGDPFTRDPKLVLEDVWEEKLSIEYAQREYRVAITRFPFSIDWEATNVLRKGNA